VYFLQLSDNILEMAQDSDIVMENCTLLVEWRHCKWPSM